MKKITLIILAVLFMAMPVLTYAQQESSPKEEPKEEKKISYSFINEYGFYAGGTVGFAGVFVNGIRFNKTQDLIGIGLGYEFDIRAGQSMPIYVNYRHYFSHKKILKPLINVGVGARLIFDDYYCYDCWSDGPSITVMPGLYATIAGGFKVKAFTFTSGAFLKSVQEDFYAGFEVKAGFTF